LNNEQTSSWGIQQFLGWVFIAISLSAFYWVFTGVISLWDDPSSVPFIAFFVEKLIVNGAPIISGPGGEINWPDNLQVIVGVFLTIVLISSIGLLAKTFLVAGLCLLFPKIHFYGGLNKFKNYHSLRSFGRAIRAPVLKALAVRDKSYGT